MYQPPHEITLTPYLSGPPRSPFLFGAACTCQQWMWLPDTFPAVAMAVRDHLETALLLVDDTAVTDGR